MFDKIAIRIISEQEQVIGPLAWDEARKVSGLKILDPSSRSIAIEGDKREIIDRLVNQYNRLFGKASQEVSREAVSDLIADLNPAEVPSSLK